MKLSSIKAMEIMKPAWSMLILLIFGLDNQCLGKHVERGHCYYINNYPVEVMYFSNKKA